MKNLLAMILAATGTLLANVSISACPAFFLDEPKLSRKMLEK